MKGSTIFHRGAIRKALTGIGAVLVSFAIFSGGGKNQGIIPEGLRTGCEAEAAVISSDAAFSDLNWGNLLIEADALSGTSVAQSVCVTQYYIIVMENAAEDPHQPDRVTAYYRLPYDEKGNAVRPFTRAKSVQDTDWEHCNGMAYNPRTDKVYVSLYTSLQGGNNGDIYIMNPYTLDYEDRIHISDDYNILGIGYDSVQDRYIIQTDVVGGFAIKILDSNFQIIDDLGGCDPSPGRNFNDLCVCGDYVLNNPVTNGMNIGEYLNVYSLSRRGLVGTFPETYGITDADPASLETESICELGQGEFLALVNLTTNEGQRKYRLYWTTVPMDFSVSVLTSGEGSAGGATDLVSRGADFELSYQAQDGYQLTGIVINGKAVNIDGQDKTSGVYRIQNVQADQTIDVRFAPAVVTQTPLPTEKPEGTEAVQGTSVTDSVSTSSAVAGVPTEKKNGGKGTETNLALRMIRSFAKALRNHFSYKLVLQIIFVCLMIALAVVIGIGVRVDMIRKRNHRRFQERRMNDEARLMKKREEDLRFARSISEMSYDELRDLR